MADNTQLPPPAGPVGYSAVSVQPGPGPSRALLVAALLIAAGAVLGLLGGLIWAAAAPRVLYQVFTLTPPTAYATNPETNAFIGADGIYTFIGLGGGALLGLAGYLFGVRRYGPVPMVGVVLGAVAAAFLAKWLGTLLTGGQSFNAKLASSKPGALLRAPITLGAHGAIAFWPVAAALTAGLLELLSVLQARRLGGRGEGAASEGLAYRQSARPRHAAGPAPQVRRPSPAPLPPPPASAQPPPGVGPASSRQPWPGGPAGPPAGNYGLPDADQRDRPVG
jgi:hypothetical protein